MQDFTASTAWEAEKESSAFMAASLRLALRRNDAALWGQTATEAVYRKDGCLADVLSEVFAPQSRWERRKRGRQEAWRQAKLMTIAALKSIGNEAAITGLANALFDPDPQIRGEASMMILGFGEQAHPTLFRLVYEKTEWELPGMMDVVTALGTYRNQRTARALQKVLTGELPRPSKRWRRSDPLWPLRPIGLLLVIAWVVTTIVALIVSFGQMPWSWALLIPLLTLLGTLMMGVAPGGMLYCGMLLFVTMPNRAKAGMERDELAAASAEALGRMQDKQSIPHLLLEALSGNARKQAAVHTALCALLPLLTAADSEWLRGELLYRLTMLMDRSDSLLVLTIVRALEFVGTGRSAVPVARLSTHGSTPTIRTEAMRVLPLLEERWRQEQSSSSLLRASQEPALTPGELLRAAQFRSETPVEQLLRPGTEQN